MLEITLIINKGKKNQSGKNHFNYQHEEKSKGKKKRTSKIIKIGLKLRIL